MSPVGPACASPVHELFGSLVFGRVLVLGAAPTDTVTARGEDFRLESGLVVDKRGSGECRISESITLFGESLLLVKNW